MTLVVAVNGPNTIWMVADRRLTYEGRAPRDDARKIMCLQSVDGVALVGYAGLGATAAGTEPSEWMASVLRTLNLPLEQAIGRLADAVKAQFPPHLIGLPADSGKAHAMVICAFLGKEARAYTITMEPNASGADFDFNFRRWIGLSGKAPRISLAGSGALHLAKDKSWIRGLLRVARAYDRGKVRPEAVADQLAAVSYEAHNGTRDKSVGPSSIVVCRPQSGGGAHWFYTGTERDKSSPGLPTITHGYDVDAILRVMMPRYRKVFEGWKSGEPLKVEFDERQINAELARLPDKPDEKLK